MMKRGFPAVLDEKTEILILGSLPGDESLRKQQYYGNPGNDFWRLVGRAIGENLQDMDYNTRLEILKRNRLGLWDVFKAGSRDGSQDSKIKDEEINQFSILKEIAPELKLVCFNGKKSGEYEPFLRKMGYKTKVLPSSSGMNRRFLKIRESEWEAALKR
ncbi:2-hydroxyacid dehydrogenase [Methanosarcina sp. 2.H.T.1A.6]|uniref:DNA-deoxyinosine glycosylase n=1 Tax=unclassified Methanosarcina TaxID=2644672 RepID=UPI0006216AF9|nr:MULTISPECIES: DNA-deoxyinosine glycosylase [unclassified Methanosarcina]KKG13788.1 2-hydroxyacid dehydrogenase [Methanosarcina sp. 2.H.T.1A.3]KKG23132.1 2-hydroxyacid dehydrogenase [Methanosarcina sp. 2.H.T.1A.6]KKG26355.1 2-hydroxyacid dehydrogenase [Methanosarcina sp. 2.H.T.1A.8]KKG28080.1 2-hydroxyacid dehydrogenase [Methanosarcina sp. 2.H.T.1A.15]